MLEVLTDSLHAVFLPCNHQSARGDEGRTSRESLSGKATRVRILWADAPSNRKRLRWRTRTSGPFSILQMLLAVARARTGLPEHVVAPFPPGNR
eukprot:741458-Hanusia_phi.AAC.1